MGLREAEKFVAQLRDDEAQVHGPYYRPYRMVELIMDHIEWLNFYLSDMCSSLKVVSPKKTTIIQRFLK